LHACSCSLPPKKPYLSLPCCIQKESKYYGCPVEIPTLRVEGPFYKNHVSILATDFEKAFDRVGLHSVLYQLELWGVGPRPYNFIKAFMTNRTFRVRVNNSTSNLHKLHNGIPHGSPLSVVLFMIACKYLQFLTDTKTFPFHCMLMTHLFTPTREISIPLNIPSQTFWTNWNIRTVVAPIGQK